MQASNKTSAVAEDRPSGGRPGLAKPPSKKAGAPSGGPPPPADDDDAALAGGTLSERDAKEKLLEFLGEEGFNGLQVCSRASNSWPIWHLGVQSQIDGGEGQPMMPLAASLAWLWKRACT